MNKALYKFMCFAVRPLLKLFLGLKINADDIKGIKEPFVVLSNHATRLDFILTAAALYPHTVQFLGASHNFAIKGTRKIAEETGTIAKTKAKGDIIAVRNLKRAVDAGNSIIVFPAGMSSHSGVGYPIPDNTAKLLKFLNVQALIAKIEGGYWCLPPFAGFMRRGKVKVTIKKLPSPEDIKKYNNASLNELIKSELYYDDIEYQKANPVKLPKKRIGKLDRILYECLNCGGADTMRADADKNELYCEKCGERIFFDKFGNLVSDNPAIPDNIRDYCVIEQSHVKALKESNEFKVEDNVTRRTVNLVTGERRDLSPGKLEISGKGVIFKGDGEEVIYLSAEELGELSQFKLDEWYLMCGAEEIVFTPVDKHKVLQALWFAKLK